MRKIRVTVGTVGYYDAKHAHKRMTAADGPFECEDTQAEHFVSAGVAEYVGGAIEVDEADEQEVTGHLAKSQLEEMTIQQLQNLAGDLGVDVTGCKKKADYVDASTVRSKKEVIALIEAAKAKADSSAEIEAEPSEA
jgi:hypothetical protein